MPMNI